MKLVTCHKRNQIVPATPRPAVANEEEAWTFIFQHVKEAEDITPYFLQGQRDFPPTEHWWRESTPSLTDGKRALPETASQNHSPPPPI